MLPRLARVFRCASFKKQLSGLAAYFNQAQELERLIPRAFTSESDLLAVTKDLNFSLGQQDLVSLTQGLSQPIYDLLDRGGKRLRPGICFLIAKCFDKKPEDIIDVAALVELVHHATLMVDDIEDSSLVRRGKPCVHLLFGSDVAINAGNFLYFAPFKKLLESALFSDAQKLRMCESYIAEMTHLHLGQNWDICWHNSGKSGLVLPSGEIDQTRLPTEAQYLQMASHKTGVLCRMAVKLSCISLGVEETTTKLLSDYIERIGIAFQIQDVYGGKGYVLMGRTY